MNKLFVSKKECCVFIPLQIVEKERFVVELLDICESYLEPIKYGVSKGDIIDYLNCESEIELVDFLINKHYVSPSFSFIEIAFKYGLSNEENLPCVKMIFENIDYCDIEDFFANNPIDSIISSKTFTGNNVEKGALSKEGVFTTDV